MRHLMVLCRLSHLHRHCNGDARLRLPMRAEVGEETEAFLLLSDEGADTASETCL